MSLAAPLATTPLSSILAVTETQSTDSNPIGIGAVARKVGWNRTSVSVAMTRARHALRECVRKQMTSAEGTS